jgi:S-DNA-T family DNA segregation ATPase FtsK/SpoIIIE
MYWKWSTLVSWFTRVFGWGLLPVIIALGVSVWLLRYKKLSTLIYRWNRWLGGIAFLLVVWGILSLFHFGGSIGLGIIGSLDITGILRILGLAIIGVILLAPGTCYHLGTRFTLWLVERMKRRPAPISPRETKPSFPSVVETPKPREIKLEPPEVKPEKKTVTPVVAPVQKDLRQVAQEVWKKYGESPALITVDGWGLPPIDILDISPEVEFSQADNMQRAKLIEDALTSYGVDGKVVQINAGPTVTQFGIEPGWDKKTKEIKERDRDGNVKVRTEEVSKTRVKVERITSLANDLALSLAAPSVRIEAPVPGKPIVGIEVPNTITSMVSLRGVIETSSFQKMKTKSTLSLALGKGAGGEAVAGDLARMPHLLIAGATGSGKTVCLNSVICCLLLHNTPYDVKFIMIDPKRVELTPFNSVPHLATPVIVDTSKALGTLRWLNQEMDKRYQQLASAGARNIESYNKGRQGTDKLSYLVLIIDELADLMMTSFDEVEHILCRLAQLARAIGIHLIVATQRPSVDVVTGLIKANFPTRISFAVTSQVDRQAQTSSGMLCL